MRYFKTYKIFNFYAKNMWFVVWLIVAFLQCETTVANSKLNFLKNYLVIYKQIEFLKKKLFIYLLKLSTSFFFHVGIDFRNTRVLPSENRYMTS